MGVLKIGAKNKEKDKEKERKQRGTRKYGQANMKHSKRGIYSIVYAGISLVLLVVCIASAFVLRGNTVGIVGGICILSVMLSALGIRAGIQGMKEREKRYTTCKIGLAANVFILLGLATIFVGGL